MIYVTGDTHGDLSRFSDKRLKRLSKQDVLLICGDFGFIWKGDKAEEKALKKIAKKPYTVCFLDGTHENFDRLAAYPEIIWNGGRAQEIAPGLLHLMRGQVYDIDGTRVFAMGGGESPDIDIRFENENWSRTETPSAEELREGALNLEKHNNKVDLIVTHEPPMKLKGFLKLKDKENVRVTGLNTYFEELGGAITYTRWIFGSMHMDRFISSTHVAVYQNIVNASTGEPLK